MADELQAFFLGLADSLSATIAEEWEAAVESLMVQPIKAAAPVGDTDHLQRSVRKEAGRADEWIVEAGGPLTTKQGKNGTSYDYSLAEEFGTSHEPARPFFWPTVRKQWPRLKARADDILTSRFAKM